MGVKKQETDTSHVARVHEWLGKNVLVYENVSTVTLYGFDIPESLTRGVYSGRFKVKFDQQECPLKFTFSIGSDAVGKPVYYTPVFHSPLGAPASYGAVNIPKQAEEAITAALGKIFPSVKPLGLDRETGQILTMQTKHIDRVRYHDAMNAALNKAKAADFEFTQPVEAA